MQVEDDNNAMAFKHTENQMHSIQLHSKLIKGAMAWLMLLDGWNCMEVKA